MCDALRLRAPGSGAWVSPQGVSSDLTTNERLNEGAAGETKACSAFFVPHQAQTKEQNEIGVSRGMGPRCRDKGAEHDEFFARTCETDRHGADIGPNATRARSPVAKRARRPKYGIQ